MAARNGPLGYGLAALALGIGTAALTFLSLASDDVGYARTEWTAFLALVLAVPASALFASGAPKEDAFWRGFWTASFAAYAMHFWWAVVRTYRWDLGAVVGHQGWVAYANFAVTALWAVDVAAAWIPIGPTGLRKAIRLASWLAVTASFFVASAVFKSGAVAIAGWVLATAVAAVLARRATAFLDTGEGGSRRRARW